MTDHADDDVRSSLPPHPRPALATRPDAVLLDFGGVVFATRKRPDGMSDVAARVAEELARAGHHVPAAELLPVLAGGRTALRDWKNAASRRRAPRELTHREIWGEFYASPLPDAAREVLIGSAGSLQHMVALTTAEHTVRPGIRELLALARELGVPLGIVSNAHSGRAHRDLLARHGLTDAFGVQVYSDEVGVRKPNPEMIEIAATALGTTPERCWYVGDTYDRDVVAGRRAGAGAVILTTHHRTDEVPFPVADTPDAVFPTPEPLVDALRAAVPAAPASAAPVPPAPALASRRPVRAQPARRAGRPSAVLLDHGGVVATSVRDDRLRREFAGALAGRLTRAGFSLGPERAGTAVAGIRAAYASWKARNDPGSAPGTPEIDAATFWVDLAGPVIAPLLDAPTPLPDATAPDPAAGDVVVPGALRAWLRAEAHDLMAAYARAKSVPTVRPGVRELLAAARASGVPVAVVSNTVNGRSVREELDEAGLTPLIGAHVYSDEVGVRKPDPVLPATALRALGAEAGGAWFVGDKPHRDVLAARAAGVGHVVLVRGGATSDADLDALPGDDPARPDHVVADMTALPALLGLGAGAS